MDALTVQGFVYLSISALIFPATLFLIKQFFDWSFTHRRENGIKNFTTYKEIIENRAEHSSKGNIYKSFLVKQIPEISRISFEELMFLEDNKYDYKVFSKLNAVNKYAKLVSLQGNKFDYINPKFSKKIFRLWRQLSIVALLFFLTMIILFSGSYVILKLNLQEWQRLFLVLFFAIFCILYWLAIDSTSRISDAAKLLKELYPEEQRGNLKENKSTKRKR